MNKKAQMLSIFKYIFVLIVGAMFIIFFIKFAFRYQDTAGSIDQKRFIHSLEDILSALGASSDGYLDFDFGQETSLNFLEGEIHSGEESKKTKKIIYASSELSGKAIKIWTRKWSFPYPIDNFYYIINSQSNYLIFPSDDFLDYAQELADPTQEIPKNFNTLLVNTEEDFLKIKSSITPRTKLILIGEDTSVYNKLKKLSSNIIIIKPHSLEEPEYGVIEFADSEQPYLGRPMLFGAMYADEDIYEANLKIAMQRAGEITDIYMKKADYLNGKITGCAYSLFKTNLESFKTLTEEAINTESFAQMYTSMINANEDLGRGCPSVF